MTDGLTVCHTSAVHEPLYYSLGWGGGGGGGVGEVSIVSMSNLEDPPLYHRPDS